MQLRISPSMRGITISSNNGVVLDSMKVKVGARPLPYRTVFYTSISLPFLLPFLFIIATFVTLEGVDNCSSIDNVLAASVVVTSAVRSSLRPEKIVFHVITDKKTFPAMHSWFALYSPSPAIVEVKGVHQFDWLTRENVPVLGAIESNLGVRNFYHGDHVKGSNVTDNPRILASKLQARNPKYISLLYHILIYLPELFPNLN